MQHRADDFRHCSESHATTVSPQSTRCLGDWPRRARFGDGRRQRGWAAVGTDRSRRKASRKSSGSPTGLVPAVHADCFPRCWTVEAPPASAGEHASFAAYRRGALVSSAIPCRTVVHPTSWPLPAVRTGHAGFTMSNPVPSSPGGWTSSRFRHPPSSVTTQTESSGYLHANVQIVSCPPKAALD
jgi:hypothetical protein